jgi:hypothetical protein
MSHTSGPWAFEMFAVGDMAEMQYISQDENYYGDDGKSICLIAGHEWKHPDNDKRKGKRHYLTEESVANARLIAAAPELLEALNGLLDQCDLGEVNEETQPLIDAAKAAINKATGVKR